MEQPTKIDFTILVQKVVAHPDRFLKEVGDTYMGIPIVRDPTLPKDEIHVISGNRRTVFKYNIPMDT
jgi:hypothetical protein